MTYRQKEALPQCDRASSLVVLNRYGVTTKGLFRLLLGGHGLKLWLEFLDQLLLSLGTP